MKRTVILLLAAGNSTRMGTIKQLLPYKQTTLLGWAIKQAQQSKACDVFCVLGANAEIIKEQIEQYKVEIIFNVNYDEGLSASIVAGINHFAHKEIDAVIIMLADQPNVNSIYLNELMIVSEINPTKIVASNYEEKIGVPAIFPKHYFDQLLNLKGDKGAKEFLNKHQSEIIKMKPCNLIDIDTKEEYQKLIK